MVELDDVSVKQVLSKAEQRHNWIFVSRNKAVDEVKADFAEQKLLEAVMITETGKTAERLLGIVTRSNILRHKS